MVIAGTIHSSISSCSSSLMPFVSRISTRSPLLSADISIHPISDCRRWVLYVYAAGRNSVVWTTAAEIRVPTVLGRKSTAALYFKKRALAHTVYRV